MATPRTDARVSARVAAIAESATLAVDAKAKALQAAGEPVIGFGAGEPDFPTPAHIVEAAVGGLPRPQEPQVHARRRPPGAEGGDRRQDDPRLRLRRADLGRARHQRWQARRLQHLHRPARPGRRGAAPRAVLDHLPRADRAGRWGVRGAPHRRDHRLPRHRRPARGRPHPPHQDPPVRVAVEPHGRGVPGRGGRGHRPLGRGARDLGGHRRDLRAPDLRRPRARVDAGRGARAAATAAWSSTASPRPTP